MSLTSKIVYILYNVQFIHFNKNNITGISIQKYKYNFIILNDIII